MLPKDALYNKKVSIERRRESSPLRTKRIKRGTRPKREAVRAELLAVGL